jgi:chemotaxis protein MotA
MLVFVHLPSVLLTVGGTAFVTWMSFPREQLVALVAALREAIGRCEAIASSAEQVKALARAYRLEGPPGLEAAARDITNPYLRRGVEMLTALKQPDGLRAALEGEHVRRAAHYDDCRRILVTVGKLLPAFGLIGTLMSLVLLLRQSFDLTTEGVGSALSLAILTTLYGAVLANAVVLPLEAKLQTLIERQRLALEIGLCGAELIAAGAFPSVIDERLGCFELPGVAWADDAVERATVH